MRYPVMELRQYDLRPGQRDVLIELFDREFVESQEALGMAIVGQFRDLDHPDRFVWLRGFSGVDSRAEALRKFYNGSVWKAHSAAANATMLDVGNVLLLRPATPRSGFPQPSAGRPPASQAAAALGSLVVATLYYRDRPFDEDFSAFFEDVMRPLLAGSGAAPLAWFSTEYADNDFPALPVRTGEHVFAWFARFATPADLTAHQDRLRHSVRWLDEVEPALSGHTEVLRLSPTARSLLR